MKLRVLRFLISGGSAAAVEYSAFAVLQLVLGSDWLLLNQSSSFGCGFVVSFLMNRHWVFRSSGPMGGELAKYGFVAAINLCASNLAIFLLAGPAGFHPLAAKFVTMGMVAAWNYLIFSRLVFKSAD
ncbi:GtrA family protein [Stenotrophomonas sp. ISL-67]|uniref:GtrA family protein n=1 Tax=Stenotrophomonas sp. ISL-67 TaxID=2819171 RepID=UPI001BE69430|nr:GtrA family protein [Stenotrophomonas sp. ISL-67]MBT2768140.1 GtrA family protein [Stenotrophomonas sp. ISL-67]